MLEIPVLLLGLWCNPVRYELNNNLLVYSKSQCWAGDNFLAIRQREVQSPRVRCDLIKIIQIGEGRWNQGTEMAFNLWLDCPGWQQKFTLVENRWLRVSSDWIEYPPGYAGPGRTLLRW